MIMLCQIPKKNNESAFAVFNNELLTWTFLNAGALNFHRKVLVIKLNNQNHNLIGE